MVNFLKSENEEKNFKKNFMKIRFPPVPQKYCNRIHFNFSTKLFSINNDKKLHRKCFSRKRLKAL